MDRDKMEKERIAQRVEKFHKHTVVGNIIADENSKQNDNTYMRKPDLEYLNFVNREQQKMKNYARIEQKRKENLIREEIKWSKEEQAAKLEIEKTKKLQNIPFKSEKNKSKSSRDIITHQVNDNAAAAKAEEKQKIFTQHRKQYLSSKMSSGYNPITGEQKKV